MSIKKRLSIGSKIRLNQPMVIHNVYRHYRVRIHLTFIYFFNIFFLNCQPASNSIDLIIF